MIKYSIIHTPQFKREARNIYQYFCFSLHSPQTGQKLFKKISNIIFHLDLFPERYSKVFIPNKLQNRNLRKIPINNYIIIYEVDNYNHNVFILHIFHGKQNYLDKL